MSQTYQLDNSYCFLGFFNGFAYTLQTLQAETYKYTCAWMPAQAIVHIHSMLWRIIISSVWRKLMFYLCDWLNDR